MKTALCITGYPRTFDKVKNKYWNHIVVPHDADVFIYSTDTFFAKPEYDIHHIQDEPKKITKEFFINVFKNKLVKCSIIEYNALPFKEKVKEEGIPENNFIKQPAWRILSQYYNMAKVLELKQDYEKEHNFTYDRVILTRYDLDICETFKLDNMDLNLVHYPAAHTYKYDTGEKIYGAAAVFGTDKHLNDQILISNSKNMDIICNIYPNSKKYHDKGFIVNNETYIGVNFIEYGIEFVPTDFTSYNLQRT